MYKLISHRGIYSKEIKENSYDAIRKALDSHKFVGVEFDVRETKDNELIVFHDALYNNKLVSNTYYNEMPKYVPKLQDILKIDSNKIFLIEIKDIKNSYHKFVKLINKFNKKNIYVMSFSNKVIKRLNLQNKEYKVGVLNYILNTNMDIKKLDFVVVLNNLLTDDVINKLPGLEIFSYGGFYNKKHKNIFYIVDEVVKDID